MINNKKLDKFLPLLVIIFVICFIAVKNIVPGTYFSGWDNSHPEFNLPEFTKRVISGAWVEFQGTGAPAAQSQLAEISRLPYIYLLKLFVPDNLNRYFFTFMMVLIGGITLYYYLFEIWLSKMSDGYRRWLSCFGALYYVLNIISLQQFFINFEQFAVEFAYFPLVLLMIHKVSEKFTLKNTLYFIVALILFIPTAYVPTIFYIAFIFFVVYAFFINLDIRKNFFKALKITGLISFIILAVNSFWLLPNIYYVIHDSHYVQESRANGLFDAEALWSVREAGNLQNFLTGVHFIFNWQDFNFTTSKYELIYNIWLKFLSNPMAIFLLIFFNLLTLAGFVSLLVNAKAGLKRWGLIFIYFITTLFIWIGFILPNSLTNHIYNFGLIREAFRNPFTKFSNYYSFAITIMLCIYMEQLIYMLQKLKSYLLSSKLPIIILTGLFMFLFYISWPSFTGNFLNSKLRIKYPQEYTEMFTFLKTKPKDSRVLELPFMSHEGWLYYNWPSEGIGNGYQGMGFYLFGFPQPLMTPDHARWTEATDFFYYELRYALNSQNSIQFKNVLEKYYVNLIILDKTSIWKYNLPYDYNKLNQILIEAGYSKVWNKNFLSIYEGPSDQIKKGKLLIPKQVNFVSANTSRVRRDYVYESFGEYIIADDKKADTIFPFVDLTSLELKGVKFNSTSVEIQRKITSGNYVLTIPGIKTSKYTTKVEITYKNNGLKLVFPKTKMIIGTQEIFLPQLQDFHINIDKKYDAIALWFNDKLIQINNNQIIYPSITMELNQPIKIYYSGVDSSGIIDYKQAITNQVDWAQWTRDIVVDNIYTSDIKLVSEFPILKADLKKFLPSNCSNPQTGNIKTLFEYETISYTAMDNGVSCGHFDSDYFTADSSFLMQIQGGNFQGRSIKFFIDYNVQNSLPEEYLMPDKNSYSQTLGFMPIITTALKPFYINWETRSYGKTSLNKLSSIKIAVFPIERFNQIELKKTNINSSKTNNITLVNSKSYLTFLYFATAQCPDKKCFIGINQSYDDLWLAIDYNLKILPHIRYNNWANLWEIENSSQIMIVYIPQVIAFIGLFILITLLISLILIIFIRKARPL